MLARLVSRRMAWLGLLVVGSTPMFCMIARNAIPDMPMVACTIGALALFTLAVEDGERPITPLGRLRPVHASTRATSCSRSSAASCSSRPRTTRSTSSRRRSSRSAAASRTPRCGCPARHAAAARRPVARRLADRAPAVRADRRRDRRDRQRADAAAPPRPDRVAPRARRHPRAVGPPRARSLRSSAALAFLCARRVLRPARARRGRPRGSPPARSPTACSRMAPLTTMRQVYLLGLLRPARRQRPREGPARARRGRRASARSTSRASAAGARSTTGAFELKRGLLLMIVVAVPWHVAMCLKDGPRVHRRVPVHAHPQPRGVGRRQLARHVRVLHVPDRPRHVAVGRAPAGRARAPRCSRARTRHARGPRPLHRRAVGDRRGRGVLPRPDQVPPLHPARDPAARRCSSRSSSTISIARRERLHPLFAALGIGIVLLVTRDLMFEPERWIEMFVFRYDRPWPGAEPYSIDPVRRLPRARPRSPPSRSRCCATPLAPARRRARSAPPASRSACGRCRSTCRSPARTGACARPCAPTTSSARSTASSSSTSALAQLHDEWADAGDTRSFETFLPDHAPARSADDDPASRCGSPPTSGSWIASSSSPAR